MKLHGSTSTDDWHPTTLLDMMRRRECWHCGVRWRTWWLRAYYVWYDGPHWFIWMGPFWAGVYFD